MNTGSECRRIDDPNTATLAELELSDLNVDQTLLSMKGISLLIFTGAGCASCRVARAQLPGMPLNLDRLCWIDAGHSYGAVQRYEVFHLPAMFVIADGQFFGELPARLLATSINHGLAEALGRPPEELP